MYYIRWDSIPLKKRLRCDLRLPLNSIMLRLVQLLWQPLAQNNWRLYVNSTVWTWNSTNLQRISPFKDLNGLEIVIHISYNDSNILVNYHQGKVSQNLIGIPSLKILQSDKYVSTLLNSLFRC